MTTMFYGSLTCLTVAGLLTLVAAQQDQKPQRGSMGSGSPMSSDSKMGSDTKMGPGAKMSMADQKFVKEAAQGGMAEVELGQLAVQKASNEDVKKFGRRMVDDHSKANDKLKEIASNKGITLPSSPDAKQKATKERLSKLSGEQFDKAYMTDMLKDHKKDVAAFQNESNTGKDSDIKNFAAETLPTLRDHLKDAQDITPKVVQARTSMAPSASQQ